LSTEAAAYTVLALVLCVSAAWCHGWWARGRYDTARRTAVLAERAARPPDARTPAVDAAVAVAMAWCCDTWFLTAGTDHDRTRCTRHRKDQTT
jgi:hypothetical protein